MTRLEKNNMIYFVKNIVEGFDGLYYNDGECLKQSSKIGVRYIQIWEIVEHEKKQS